MIVTLYSFINRALISSVLISFSFGCSSPESQEKSIVLSENSNSPKPALASFELIDEVKSETSGKAQLIEYALYRDSVYSEPALKNVVMGIYNINRDKNVFLDHDRATVVAVYLFTSKEAFMDKSDWITMLIKGPMDEAPVVSYNHFKITALSNLKDDIKSDDEIELEKLNFYLDKRGIDLCGLSELLKKIELENIHRADAAYPDYGAKHTAMIERLDNQAYNDLKRKYKLDENIFTKVSVFAMSYCN